MKRTKRIKIVNYTYRLLIAISTLIFMISCERTPKEWEKGVKSVGDLFDVFDKKIKLNAEIYIDDSIQLINPYTIKIIGNYLFILDYGSSTNEIVSVYDMTNKSFIRRMFNCGQGPNEFLGLRMSSLGNDTLLALDHRKKYAQIFVISDIKLGSRTPHRVISFDSPAKGEQIDQCYFFNNTLICSGQFQKGRFQIYDTKGKFHKEFDEFPSVEFAKNQIDNIQLGYIFGPRASFGKNSQMSKITCTDGNTLSIYDYNKNKDEFTKTFFVQWEFPRIGEATYKDGKPFVTSSAKDNLLGSGNLAANDKYIFIPFSTYNFSEAIKKGIDNPFNYILVVNWDGIPTAKMILDKAIQFPLEIDQEGKYLYSIHIELETGFPQIIRYDISFL